MRIPLPFSRRKRIGAAFVTLAHVPERWEPVFPPPTCAKDLRAKDLRAKDLRAKDLRQRLAPTICTTSIGLGAAAFKLCAMTKAPDQTEAR
jgi:hypothetical protein